MKPSCAIIRAGVYDKNYLKPSFKLVKKLGQYIYKSR
jgi:hypothetical protein